MTGRDTLLDALEVLCRDSLESTVDEVRVRDDDGEVSVALRNVIYAADQLSRIAGTEDHPEWGAQDSFHGIHAIRLAREDGSEV